MKLVLKSNISTILAIFLALSLTLALSCTEGEFSGSSAAEDEGSDDDDDDDDIDPESGDGTFDSNQDNEISEDEYDSLKDQLGQVEFSVKRIEGDCINGCNATATFSLYSIDGTKVSSKVKEKSKTTVHIDQRKEGVSYDSGDGSHLCPLVKKNVVLSMSLTYGADEIESSSQRIVGGRENKQTIWVGVADTTDHSYNFHNVDTIITSIKCPKVKKLKIKNLCEDSNLDNANLRYCWKTRGTDSACKDNNIWSNSEYPVQCK